MMRRTLTPAEMRERSEMCRRERQHLLRYAIWNSRRIREEREREEKAATVHSSPTKQADADSPKRLPLQPIHNTSVDNSRLVASSVDADCSSDDDTSSESSDTSSSDADGDDLDDVLDSLSKLNSPGCPSHLAKSCADRLSEAKLVDSSSSSDDTDKLSEEEVGDGSSNDDVERLSEEEGVDSSSSNDDVDRLSEAEELDCSPSSDDSDDSWSDCEDSDGDGCSCCVISAGRASGYSDTDLAVFFQRVSKRFNAMITSVHQTRI